MRPAPTADEVLAPSTAANGSSTSPAGRSGAVAFASRPPRVSCASPTAASDFAAPRRSRASPSRRRACASRVARYNGVTPAVPGDRRQARRPRMEGRASRRQLFRRTAISSSPPCRRTPCTAGGSRDGKHMRMTGYPAKVKILSWSAKGRWLASSGARAAILWPFHSRTGRWARRRCELRRRGRRWSPRVACHPREEIVAIGYEDGMVLAVRFADGKEVLLRRPAAGPVSALGWAKSGIELAFGTEVGEAGVVASPAELENHGPRAPVGWEPLHVGPRPSLRCGTSAPPSSVPVATRRVVVCAS